MERRVVEGYFPARNLGRTHFVSVEPGRTELVLADPGEADGEAIEQRTAIPHAHAEALLDLCAGRVGFDRTRIRLGSGFEIVLERVVHPATLDLVTVLPGEGPFEPPAWLGPEVTRDAAWDKRSIAFRGAPEAPEIPLSNAALDALLSDLEARPNGAGRPHG